jgi:hypothetical protein
MMSKLFPLPLIFHPCLNSEQSPFEMQMSSDAWKEKTKYSVFYLYFYKINDFLVLSGLGY